MDNIQSLRTDDCIDEVISLYANMVYRIAFSYTGKRDEADDIFQEVFIRYINYDKPFTSEEHRKAWLIRVTVNCSKSLFRSFWKRNIKPVEEVDEKETTFEMQEETDLYLALMKLPKKYRTVIHLYYYEDLSTKDISRILQENESTIRSRLKRGREKLKEYLREEWNYE